MSNISKLVGLLVVAALSASPAAAQGLCESPASNSVSGGFAERAAEAGRAWSAGQPITRAAASRQRAAAGPAPVSAQQVTRAPQQQGMTTAEALDIFSTVLGVGVGIAAVRNQSRAVGPVPGPAPLRNCRTREIGCTGNHYCPPLCPGE